MLTLKRFKAMADCYGADLRRWPESMRKDAETLIANSQEANTLLAEAREFDEAIRSASLHEDASLWLPGEQDAALARLRSGVAAQLSVVPGSRSVNFRSYMTFFEGLDWMAGPRLGWAGLAASSVVAVVAGLLIGSAYDMPSGSGGLLAMLQPVPIEILAD
jgi:hypothetical protein